MAAQVKRIGNLAVIHGDNNGNYPYCNTIIVHDRVKALIDPGCGPEPMKELAARGGVDVIINSHCHEDHAYFNGLFPDAEIWVHGLDAPAMESAEALCRASIEPQLTAEERDKYLAYLEGFFGYTGWRPARLLQDGDELELGDTLVRVVHAPGHTPGHIVLHFPNEQLVYLADIDLTRFGPWYGDATSSVGQTLDSMDKALAIEAEWFVTGHEGPVWDDVGERAREYRQLVLDRESRIMERLERPASIPELASQWIIYGKPRNPVEVYAVGERAMIAKHLERLVELGLAVREGELYRRA